MQTTETKQDTQEMREFLYFLEAWKEEQEQREWESEFYHISEDLL